jgi:4-hydroxybenzoyl-CoA reductase subunit beta
LALIAANLVPLAGVFLFGWEVFPLLLLFWFENVIIGFFNALKMLFATPIRSTATVGGNLCLETRCVFFNQSAFWRSGRPACLKAGGKVCHVVSGTSVCRACHQSDLAPVLIAVGAKAILKSSEGARTIPLEELYSGDGHSPLNLKVGELLESIEMPGVQNGASSAYQKLRMRKGLDFPAASAAVCLERGADGLCSRARVVLGAVASGPMRVVEAEAALVGSKLEDDVLVAVAAASTAAAMPVNNVDLTAAYRKKIAGILAKRAALAAWQRIVQC